MPSPTKFHQKILGPLAPLKNWLLGHPRAVSIVALSVTALAALHLLLRSLPIYWGDPIGVVELGHEGLAVFEFVRKSYYFWLWMLFPVVVLAMARSKRDGPPFKAVALASAAVFVVWVASEIATHGVSKLQLAGVEPSVASAFFRLTLTGGLILSPPLLVWLYTKSPLLSRYVLRQFLTPFAYCFAGFIAVWLVIDLSDNGPDFFDLNAPLGTVIQYYIVQFPQIVVTILPITLLLALLYSLGKMSKSNEIISMITAGKSLPRVLMPLFFVGFYSSLVTLALNYEWAPEAEARKEAILASIEEEGDQSKRAKRYQVRARVYRNREDRRTWFVGRIPFDLATDKMRGVEVYQTGPDGRAEFAIYADKAAWNYQTREWRFLKGKKFFLNTEGDAIPQYWFDVETISNWRETPWKIFSESLVPEKMGVPGLSFHLRTNADNPPKLLAPFETQRHYRWALPWSCFVITLVAAPLGIVFSRRGMMGGVAAAMLIFFGMIVFSALFLALGQSMRMPAFLGAWTTNIVLALLGLLLLRLRSRNKQFPKPNLARAWKWVTGLGSKNGRGSAGHNAPAA